MTTVAVLGAGVAGLTVAHELAARGLSVEVYERHAIPGGLARTRDVDVAGLLLPAETGWRGYGAIYHNLFDVLRQIPAGEGRSVRDNLCRLHCINPANDDTRDTTNAILSLRNHTLSARERLVVLDEILFALCACPRRLLERDPVSWVERVHRRAGGVSARAYKYVVHSLGPYLGLSSESCNASSVTVFVEQQLKNAPRTEFYQASAPTSEAWFDHWRRELERRGVRFHFGTRVVGLGLGEARVESLQVEDARGRRDVRADYYVCALSVEGAAALVTDTPRLAERDAGLRALPLLAQRGHQIMLSVQFYLDRRVDVAGYPFAVHGLYLPDSPWAIMIQTQAGAWEGHVDLASRSGGRVRDVWSVGICVVDRPGLQVEKAFVDCTPEEVEREAWAQVLACQGLLAVARPEGGGTLRDVRVVGFHMWDSFARRDGRLQSWEPRFTNNVGTLRLRPDVRTAFDNLLLAGAYTRTGMEIYCMEGACESGRRAAQALLELRGAPFTPVTLDAHARPWPVFFGPLRALDRLLCALGAPHASALSGGSSIALLLLYLAALGGLGALLVGLACAR